MVKPTHLVTEGQLPSTGTEPMLFRYTILPIHPVCQKACEAFQFCHENMGLTGLFTHKPDVLSYILDLQVNSGIGVLGKRKKCVRLGKSNRIWF